MAVKEGAPADHDPRADPLRPGFAEKQLLSLLLDLFMAGAETTSNTLGFAVMFLLRHPEVQRRAQDELDRVVGRGRDPTLQDMPK